MILKRTYINNYYRLFSFAALSLYFFESFIYLFYSGPLWRDEIATISFAYANSFNEFFDLLRFNTIPIAMPFLVKTISLFSSQWVTYKNCAFLIGISSLFFIGARMAWSHPRQSAYISLLLVLLWQNIRWINSLRAYGIGLLSLLVFLFYLQVANRGRHWSKIIICSSLFAATTSFQNWPIIAVLLSFHCYFALKDSARELTGLFWAFISFFLVVILHLPFLVSSNQVFRVMQFPEMGVLDIFDRWYHVFWMVNPFGALMVLVPVIFAFLFILLNQVQRAISVDLFRLYITTAFGIVLSFGLLVSSKVVLYEWQFVLPMVFIGFQVSLLLTSLVKETFMEKVLLGVTLLLSFVPIQRPLNYLSQRNTNLDLVSDYIQLNARDSDIVILNPWEPVISFAYYYKGPCEIISVPPISKYDTHRVDEIQIAMTQSVDEILKNTGNKIAQTMKNGGRIWLIGDFAPPRDGQPPLSLEPAPSPHWGWRGGPYYQMWSEHLALVLMTKASTVALLTSEIDGTKKISPYEHAQVLRFEPE